MKTGFPDARRQTGRRGRRLQGPAASLRIAIVCAMWLTGFDVECLATLYIDKPMKGPQPLQAIAAAQPRLPGKDCGVIVDYNGMLKEPARGARAVCPRGGRRRQRGRAIVAPIEELIAGPARGDLKPRRTTCDLLASTRSGCTARPGFARIEALRDAVDALYTSDEAKRRFELMARQAFMPLQGAG